jgi:outer membrane lipoprotein-sorting protein
MKLAILLIVSLFATFVTASKDSTVEALISQINELYNNIQNVINGIC